MVYIHECETRSTYFWSTDGKLTRGERVNSVFCSAVIIINTSNGLNNGRRRWADRTTARHEKRVIERHSCYVSPL